MSEYTQNTGSARPPATDVEKLLRSLIADMLAALEDMQQANGCFDDCYWEYSGSHSSFCHLATSAIAKARGSV